MTGWRRCSACQAPVYRPKYWAGGLPPKVIRPTTPIHAEDRPETADHWFCDASCAHAWRSVNAHTTLETGT